MSQKTGFRHALPEDSASCRAIFRAAFADYEFFHMPGDADTAAKLYGLLMDGWCENCLMRGRMLLAQKGGAIAALAALQPPLGAPVEILTPGGQAAADIAAAGGADLPARLIRMFECSDAACHALPDPKWHLSALAVSPHFQRQGLGEAMLRECVIPHIVQNGGGMLTFNTNTESNRVFYRKLGFEEFDADTVTSQTGEKLGNFSFRMPLPPAKG